MSLCYPQLDKIATWSHKEIEFIRLEICKTKTNTQHFQTTHYKILKVQTHSLTHSNTLSLRPLKLSHSLTHSFRFKQSQPSAKAKSQPTVTKVVTLKQSQSIVNVVRSPPCQRYSLFLLDTLSFLLLRFLSLSLSLSNFRFWNFMM